jgi:hypothetical protein
MKPNFEAMSTQELKQYVLSNRHDDEAFDRLADRLENSQNESELYPIPDTLENIKLMEAAIQSHIGKIEQQKNP